MKTCPKCLASGKTVELRLIRMFKRDHSLRCDTCNYQEMHPSRLSVTDRAKQLRQSEAQRMREVPVGEFEDSGEDIEE